MDVSLSGSSTNAEASTSKTKTSLSAVSSSPLSSSSKSGEKRLRDTSDADSVVGKDEASQFSSRKASKYQKKNDAMLLSERRLESIEPADPELREQYKTHMNSITDQACKILYVDIPSKIASLIKLTDINAPSGKILHADDLKVSEESHLLADKEELNVLKDVALESIEPDLSCENKDVLDEKYRLGRHVYRVIFNKMVEKNYVCEYSYNPFTKQDLSEYLMKTRSVENDNSNKDEQGMEKNDREKNEVVGAIYKESQFVKKEASQMRELLNRVKIFLQLNVPKMEDGNNFGVAIQEEAINLLNRVEESAFNLHDSIFRYYVSRASIAKKIFKYPNVLDYQLAISELDKKQWIHLKITRIDLRNNYIMLYDLMQKNWKYILRPKGINPHATQNLFIT